MSKGKKKGESTIPPDILDQIVPPEFIEALRREPGNTAIRYGVSDWFTERDKVHEAEAWFWFAQTGKTPIKLTPSLAEKVDSELGFDFSQNYTSYCNRKMRPSPYVWAGAGWCGTSIEPAALGPVFRLFDGVRESFCASDPIELISSLLTVRRDASRNKNFDAIEMMDVLVPVVSGKPRNRPKSLSTEHHITLEYVFNTIRRMGMIGVTLSFGGGHDSGGLTDSHGHTGDDRVVEFQLASYGGPWVWDDASSKTIPGRPLTQNELVADIIDSPIFEQYSFNNEPVIDGTLNWDAENGSVTMYAVEVYSEYTSDYEDEDEEPKETTEALTKEFYDSPDYW